MAVVTQKPLGRIVSLLSKNRIITCKPKEKRGGADKLAEANLSFRVKSSIATQKIVPFKFFIEGEQED